jgi:hypothetical protein
MRPVRPVAPPRGAQFATFAEHQPEYDPLPASVSADGLVMTEWEPTAEELAALVAGGRVRIWLHTYGRPLQPLNVEVAAP